MLLEWAKKAKGYIGDAKCEGGLRENLMIKMFL